MAVRISRVEIASCGPVVRFREQIAPLTVVYGANERGKTAILESLTAALFRQRKDGLVPAGRSDLLGSVRVHVAGLGPRDEVFSLPDTARRPRKRRTLDEMLVQERGLPVSLFGLLVVRAGQTDFAAGRGGVDKGLLKSLLSREQTYERIAAGLPGEVAYTALAEGRVLAQRRMGAYKSHEEALQSAAQLEALADELCGFLSHSGVRQLQRRLLELGRQGELQARARRHQAFLLAGRIRESEAQAGRLDAELLRRLAAQVQEHEQLAAELAAGDGQEPSAAALRSDADWLQEAQRGWERGGSGAPGPLPALALGSCALLLLAAIGSHLLLPRLLPLALGGALAALLLAAFFSLGRRGRRGRQAREEREALRREFHRRFGRQLATAADFAAARSELDRRLGMLEQAESSRLRREQRLEALRRQVRGCLIQLGEAAAASLAEPDRWAVRVRQLAEERNHHELEAQRLRERLQGLEVDPSDYLEQDPGTPWSRAAQTRLAAEIAEVQARLRQRETEAAALRQRLAAHLGPAFAGQTVLPELAAALEERRGQQEAAAREALATIIAGHVVKAVLADFRRAEDEELERGLNDPALAQLLTRLSGRYDRLRLEAERLLVGNAEEMYDLRDMSTGAREQVLLALRLGLAAALCPQEPLFLLLDDAFQHSDWRRRRALVEQAVSAVAAGWQVIYFTMDDDIRGRFLEAARALPEDQFRLIEL